MATKITVDVKDRDVTVHVGMFVIDITVNDKGDQKKDPPPDPTKKAV
jgi:hypothetical protein